MRPPPMRPSWAAQRSGIKQSRPTARRAITLRRDSASFTLAASDGIWRGLIHRDGLLKDGGEKNDVGAIDALMAEGGHAQDLDGKFVLDLQRMGLDRKCVV